jgi:hypothetical protein
LLSGADHRSTTGLPDVGSTVSVPSAPPPWPTTLMAIVAMPCDASTEATAHGAPYMLSVKPWPKIATGHPFAGLLPAGTKISKRRSFALCGLGLPMSVGTAGMYLSGVS